MAESAAAREALLRREYGGQTARIPWRDLQTHYARGVVITVAPQLDLVDVAVQLGLDNAAAFQGWIDNGDVAGVSDEQARDWHRDQTELWAVVAAPWVLVQARD